MANYKRLAVLLAVISASVFICCFSSVLSQEKCVSFYSFESDSDTPKSDINWNMSNSNPHTGFRSLQSCGKAKSEYKLEIIGPAEIAFWWASNKGNNGIYQYQRDEGEISPYTDSGWQKRMDSVPEGRHTLKWTFSKKQSESISGWIDDICITKIPCGEACPEAVSKVSVSQKTPSIIEINNKSSEFQMISINKSSTLNKITPPNINENALVPSIHVSHPVAPQEITVIPSKDNGYDTCSKIQTAIDRIAPGGTVIITNGDYREELIINKSIELMGVDKNKTCIVGINGQESIINISSNDVSVNNLSIKGGKFGIAARDSSNITICNNVFEKNAFSIMISHCSNANIYINNNTFFNIVKEGIRLLHSSGVSIMDNNISNVKKFCIFLDDSYKNKIIGNLIDSTVNEGLYLWNSGDNTINNNTFSGPYKCKVYLQDSENDLIDSNMNCKDIACGEYGQDCSCCN